MRHDQPSLIDQLLSDQQEGTKHAMASAAVRRGVDLKRVKDALGHTDIRSTERYAKLADHSLVTVFRSRARSREPQESPRITDARIEEIRGLSWRPQRDSNPRSFVLNQLYSR